MRDNWKSYFCNVNGKLASIFLNLSLRNEAPILSKPWLLWVWLHCQSPRRDGLSDRNEAPTLFKIEDALTRQVGRKCNAVPCGRITTEGRREFYFYGETNRGFASAVRTAMSAFRKYKVDIGDQEDSLWEQYLNVLYPSSTDLERIKNREVLEVLEEHGDVLTAAREVQHWMYFQSAQSRASFRHEVVKAGFKVESESQVEGDRPFGISVIRTQPVGPDAIDETVMELLRLTEQFEGEYDGWETQVITQ